jgi:predicted lipid-binding transport protein (Tim44 family)
MQRQALNPNQGDAASAPGATAHAAPAASLAAATAPAQPAQLTLPGGMDSADFARLAKQVFIRLQAANDAGDVDDLRRFTTPELFGALRTDLLERGQAKQQTDVVQLDAEVVDVAQDDGRDVISVRFHGLVREQAEAGAEPFNELWHLVRPVQGGDWAIAGITPLN